MANQYLQYQENAKNKANYLDPLVWKVGLDFDDGPDRRVIYSIKNKTDNLIFWGEGPVDLSIDYDLRFYSTRLKDRGLKKYDFIPNGSGSPLVSKKVVDKLNELCPDEFQAIPAKVGKEDKVTGEYIPFNIECYLLNLLKYVDCVDRERSTCYMFSDPPGAIRGVKKLFFLPNCIQGYMMARAKDLSTLIIVSQEFAKIFAAPNYYGGYFKTPEELYYGLYTGNYWEKKE